MQGEVGTSCTHSPQAPLFIAPTGGLAVGPHVRTLKRNESHDVGGLWTSTERTVDQRLHTTSSVGSGWPKLGKLRCVRTGVHALGRVDLPLPQSRRGSGRRLHSVALRRSAPLSRPTLSPQPHRVPGATPAEPPRPTIPGGQLWQAPISRRSGIAAAPHAPGSWRCVVTTSGSVTRRRPAAASRPATRLLTVHRAHPVPRWSVSGAAGQPA